MQRLKPKAKFNTTTNTNCGLQRALTGYSRSIVHVRQIDATSSFQMANNVVRYIH